MVPDLFLAFLKVPLTHTGKLDRRRLCTYANKRSRHQLLGKDQTNHLYVAPSTEIEALLALLVANTLNIPVGDVGVVDNFFHRGGDSIKAVALVGEASPIQHFEEQDHTIIFATHLSGLREIPRWDQADGLLNSGEPEAGPCLEIDFGLPLVKMSIHRQAIADCLQLALTMHHSVIDGWSFRRILDQVEAVYHGNALPASPPFSALVNYVSHLPDHKEYLTNYLSGLSAERAADWLDSVNLVAPERFTRSAVLRLAWAMVQSQYEGNYDIVYGVIVSGRNAPIPGILNMTSPTVATMPLRIQLDPAASIEDTLDRLVQQTVQSIPHEQTGLQNMRRWGGDIAAACDFQTLLVIQQIDGSTGFSLLGTEAQESSFAAFCTYTLTRVCNLNVDPVEIKAWFDPNVNELICHECVEHPSRLAVDAWDIQFTYQELDELSTNLAQHLVAIGVRTGEFVPICLEKSGWTPIAMLAVIKSGAAFILLDPAVPVQRLIDSCRQAKLDLVLTVTATVQLALEPGTRVVVVDVQYPFLKDVSLPAVHPFSSGSLPRLAAACSVHFWIDRSPQGCHGKSSIVLGLLSSRNQKFRDCESRETNPL
ncbi:hypothetical protein CNMCM6069_006322 [Aspergillus lentulus]|nr:hypothetical protein CNMCM6069_006322 [Aspergillus lentulus]KAF4176128.1 hypothetical protein CNMCM8060_006545 [Aspergillus lentulus]KAF4198698.1 hypothetical protein CNMCM8694_008744 [Aspergillus lentulus]